MKILGGRRTVDNRPVWRNVIIITDIEWGVAHLQRLLWVLDAYVTVAYLQESLHAT